MLTLPEFLSNSNDHGFKTLEELIFDPIASELIQKQIFSLVENGLIRLHVCFGDVVTTIATPGYKLNKITKLAAKYETAFNRPYCTRTIIDYYRLKHGIKIQFTNLPCLVATGGCIRKLVNIEDSGMAIPAKVEARHLFPLEVIRVVIDNERFRADRTERFYGHRWGPINNQQQIQSSLQFVELTIDTTPRSIKVDTHTNEVRIKQVRIEAPKTENMEEKKEPRIRMVFDASKKEKSGWTDSEEEKDEEIQRWFPPNRKYRTFTPHRNDIKSKVLNYTNAFSKCSFCCREMNKAD